jgi:hypothetical protein
MIQFTRIADSRHDSMSRSLPPKARGVQVSGNYLRRTLFIVLRVRLNPVNFIPTPAADSADKHFPQCSAKLRDHVLNRYIISGDGEQDGDYNFESLGGAMGYCERSQRRGGANLKVTVTDIARGVLTLGTSE